MLPIAIIGYGKIARDQHVPAIRADDRFHLTGAVDPHAPPGDVPVYPDLAALTAAGDAPAAVSICTPPFARVAVARDAIAAGLHVLLEKPPGLTIGDVVELEALARNAGVTLFTAWHSQEAAGVDAARDWLADRRIEAVRVTWMEDIRVWHPGQEWILEAGGFGVFDPAINALSILTDILPALLSVESAELAIPVGRSQPIAGTLALRSGEVPVSVKLDFLHEGVQRWDIEVDTPDGMLKLAMGGAELTIAGEAIPVGSNVEYPRLYARFAELVARGESDVDLAPLRLVTDALEIGARREVEAFAFA
jgi:D-galactose 1-dehydrogenase